MNNKITLVLMSIIIAIFLVTYSSQSREINKLEKEVKEKQKEKQCEVEILQKQNENLVTKNEELLRLNTEISDYSKEISSRTLNIFSQFRSTDKKSYLFVYKSIMSESIDPPETIYDYTTDEEFTLLCQVIQAESGICDFDGKVNVATTIINRYFSETFPNSWKDLLFQKNGGIYQYTTVQNKSYLKQTEISKDTIEAIEYAFLFGSEVQNATYFHSSHSSWHENNLDLIYSDNWHKFYREKGEK